jgi:hypothetical protein
VPAHRLAVFDAVNSTIRSAELRAADSCHLLVSSLHDAEAAQRRIALGFGPAGSFSSGCHFQDALDGLNSLTVRLEKLESAGPAGAVGQKDEIVSLISKLFHKIVLDFPDGSGPGGSTSFVLTSSWAGSLHKSHQDVLNLVRRASNARDAAEHVWHHAEGWIIGVGSARAKLDWWDTRQNGGTAMDLTSDLQPLVALKAFIAQQLFRDAVGPLIERATELSGIFIDVEANVTALVAELSLLQSHGWVTSPSQAVGLVGGNTTGLTYWDLPSPGSIKAAIERVADTMRSQHDYEWPYPCKKHHSTTNGDRKTSQAKLGIEAPREEL